MKNKNKWKEALAFVLGGALGFGAMSCVSGVLFSDGKEETKDEVKQEQTIEEEKPVLDLSVFENEANYTTRAVSEGENVGGKYLRVYGAGMNFTLSSSEKFYFNVDNACLRPGHTFMFVDSVPYWTDDIPCNVMMENVADPVGGTYTAFVDLYLPIGVANFVCPDNTSDTFTVVIDKDTTISLSGTGSIYELIPNAELYETEEAVE